MKRKEGKKKIFGRNCSQNPAEYPAISWLDNWPDLQGNLKIWVELLPPLDCDVGVTVHFQFRFRFSLFAVIEVFERCNIIQNVITCVCSV